MRMKDYVALIAAARTEDDLREIIYKAFLEDDEALAGGNSLYNKVVSLAVAREESLSKGGAV